MARLDGAHAHQRTVELLGEGRLQTTNTAGRSGKTQLKIFATMQGKVQRLDLQRQGNLPDVLGQRNSRSLQLGAHPARFTDMPQVARQAITNIEQAMQARVLSQELGFMQARVGPPIAREHRSRRQSRHCLGMGQHFQAGFGAAQVPVTRFRLLPARPSGIRSGRTAPGQPR